LTLNKFGQEFKGYFEKKLEGNAKDCRLTIQLFSKQRNPCNTHPLLVTRP